MVEDIFIEGVDQEKVIIILKTNSSQSIRIKMDLQKYDEVYNPHHHNNSHWKLIDVKLFNVSDNGPINVCTKNKSIEPLEVRLHKANFSLLDFNLE